MNRRNFLAALALLPLAKSCKPKPKPKDNWANERIIVGGLKSGMSVVKNTKLQPLLPKRVVTF